MEYEYVNTGFVDSVWWKIEMYLHVLQFHNTEMAQAVETFPGDSQCHGVRCPVAPFTNMV